MESLIKWTKKDYSELRKTVNQFNRRVRELESYGREVVPEEVTYRDIKSNIYSRTELNRVIDSLNRATVKNLTESREFASGEEVSEWEFAEINKATRRAMRRITSEKESILSSRPSIGMGDERLSELRAMEESFTKLGTKKDREFERVKKRIFALGRKDYAVKKAETFRENFYTALEHLSDFKNYDKLKKQLDKFQNPLSFYEYVKQSPQLMDIFLYYISPDTNIYGGFTDNEEAFDSSLIFHLGIDIDV